MNSGEIFVIFVIPAIALATADLAMHANAWAIRRDEPVTPGEQPFKADPKQGMPLYFAYGANMDAAAMAARCPASRLIGQGRLHRHRFIIMREGYASVVREGRHTVWGVLWELALADVPALDRYEGVAGGLYVKAQQPIATPGGIKRALIYLGRSTAYGVPKPGYLDAVLAAGEAAQLPAAYLRELRGWRRGAPG